VKKNPNTSGILVLNPVETPRRLIAKDDLGDIRLQSLVGLNETYLQKPLDTFTLFERAKVNFFLRRPTSVLFDLSRAITLEPDNAEFYAARGRVLLHIDEYEKALKDFNAALEIEPNCLWSLKNRGVTYIKLSRFQEALVDFDMVLSRQENDLVALHNRALCRFLLGVKGYVDEFERTLAELPDNAIDSIERKRLKIVVEFQKKCRTTHLRKNQSMTERTCLSGQFANARIKASPT
jgi:tetratricopeptide (TPR) repeat protein